MEEPGSEAAVWEFAGGVRLESVGSGVDIGRIEPGNEATGEPVSVSVPTGGKVGMTGPGSGERGVSSDIVVGLWVGRSRDNLTALFASYWAVATR